MQVASILLSVSLALQGQLMLAFSGEIPSIVVRNLTVEEGKSVRLECAYDAAAPFYYHRFIAENINPPIFIQSASEEHPWSVYGINISNSISNLRTTPSFLDKTEQPLKIKNVTTEYHNNLVCCLGLAATGDQSTAPSALATLLCYQMNVQFSPQILQPHINIGQWIAPLRPTYGQQVVISCPLEGNPLAIYDWYFTRWLSNITEYSNNSVLIQEDYHKIKFLNDNRTLYFNTGFQEEHNGRYDCTAKNFLGNSSYNHFPLIDVYECTEFLTQQPSATINASHTLVAYVGDDLNIDCVVASIPSSGNEITWWYNNHYEIYYSPSARVHFTKSSFDKDHCRKIVTLSIGNLTFKDSGSYSCISQTSDLSAVNDTILLTVTVPSRQPNYKLLILKIGVPTCVVLILCAIFVTFGILHYKRKRQLKLQQALEEYQRRPLPKKGNYQYEFFLATTEEDADKLEVDKLYVSLKQSFSIYYQLDQYLPGRTKVEMVSDGIRNSRFIVLILSKAYLQRKDEITQLEIIYTMNRLERELTKCAFIVTLEDNLFIPYKLRHIVRFSKESAENKLREIAASSDIYGPDFISFPVKESIEDTDYVEEDNTMVIELLNLLNSNET